MLIPDLVGGLDDLFDSKHGAPEGLERLEQLCDRYLSHVERGVFPGGCFFASTAAEWDTRPGPGCWRP